MINEIFCRFVVLRVILYPHPNWVFAVVNGIIFQTLAILAVSSHVRTMLTDPGENVNSSRLKGIIF
jgi:palmitoyltransferase ZDHHC3/7/25